MKCQRCSKPATYHITEVEADGVEDLHLCEGCAQKHLAEPITPTVAVQPPPPKVNLDDLADLGNKQCNTCGIKFVEFRNTGRLGCQHDYEVFREELLPLFDNIHGDTKHVGKKPRRLPELKHANLELAQLRHQLQVAVQSERYEEAAQLRDRIKKLES
jgi:protein arginine kinase activator